MLAELTFGAAVGRTLERTRVAAVGVDREALDRACEIALRRIREDFGELREIDEPCVRALVLGVLRRMNIRGRARKLRLNYRTTEETRRWASGLLDRCSIDDLDGGADSNRGVRSVARGPEPRLKLFQSRDEQAAWLVQYLNDLLEQGEPPRGVCIVARTRRERDAIGEVLVEAELPIEVLEADSPDEASGGVRLATMHRVKGLEFDRMVIATVNHDAVPLAAAVQDENGSAHAAAETSERALLYVAATRAKKELSVLSFGTPSPFVS